MKTPTFALLIPVFDDDRVRLAIASGLSQNVPFDEIVIQNPNGKYRDLEKLSPNIRVIVEPDRNLFDGLDILVANAKSDFVVMIGSDDFLLDDDFVARAKAKLTETPAQIYTERSLMVGKTVRPWPTLWWVMNSPVLPTHFGTFFDRQLASKHRMDHHTDYDIYANDSVWLHKVLAEAETGIVGSDEIGLCMEAGGVSTGGWTSSFKNLRSFARKSARVGDGGTMAFMGGIIALIIKSVTWLVFSDKTIKKHIEARIRQLKDSISYVDD